MHCWFEVVQKFAKVERQKLAWLMPLHQTEPRMLYPCYRMLLKMTNLTALIGISKSSLVFENLTR